MASNAPALPGCLYFEEAPRPADYPEMEGEVRVPVLVVGAGFTGLSTALHLRERGADVAVIDAEEPGFGASGRNGGQVNAGLKLDPKAAVAALGSEFGEKFVKASSDAPAYVFDLVRRHGIDCDAANAGSIRVVREDHEAPLIDAAVSEWGERGVKLERLDGAALQRLVGTDIYPVGLLDRRGGSVNPLLYVRGLAAAVTSRGGRVHGGSPARSIERDGSRWRVKTPRATITADTVVLATNGYTGDLWPGLRQTVIPIFSAIAATDPLPPALLAAILPERQVAFESSWRVLYFRIDRAGRLLMGGPSPQVQSGRPALHRHLVRRAEALFPAVKGVGWRYFWNGQVALTEDHLPHLHEPAPGVIAALGYSGRGIAMSTTMGRVVADRILGAKPAELPFPITPIKGFRFHALWRPMVDLAQLRFTITDRLRRLA